MSQPKNDEIENVSTDQRFLKTQSQVFGGGPKSLDQEISEKTSDMFTLWFDRIYLQTQTTPTKPQMCAREAFENGGLVCRMSDAACNV